MPLSPDTQPMHNICYAQYMPKHLEVAKKYFTYKNSDIARNFLIVPLSFHKETAGITNVITGKTREHHA